MPQYTFGEIQCVGRGEEKILFVNIYKFIKVMPNFDNFVSGLRVSTLRKKLIEMITCIKLLRAIPIINRNLSDPL